MTRRDKLERKLEKRRDWAEGRERKARQRFGTADELASYLTPGQPILVGHYSEKRHRRHLERIDSNMGKGVEHSKMAEHHKSKAAGLEAQLKTSIYSDDDDATEALQTRIAERELERDKAKAVNAAWRKAKKPKADDRAGWEAIEKRLLETLGSGADVLDLVRRARLNMARDFLDRAPFPPYWLSNLSGRIKADRDRLERVKTTNKLLAAADAAGGVRVDVFPKCEHSGKAYAAITFAEKPAREILIELKAAVFHWSRPCWRGEAENVPQSVRDMAEEAS